MIGAFVRGLAIDPIGPATPTKSGLVASGAAAASEAALGGGILLHGTPADFGKLIAEETEKWGKVIRAASVKVE